MVQKAVDYIDLTLEIDTRIELIKTLSSVSAGKPITAMVQKAVDYIDLTLEIDTRIELIKTLSGVSAGKIYVEIERAGLIKRLTKIIEEQGQIDEAADLMQELAVVYQVETFGCMAQTGKIAFILDQIL